MMPTFQDLSPRLSRVEKTVKIDRYGRVSITEQEAFNALYSGKLRTLNGVSIIGDIEKYNLARQHNADPLPALTPQDILNIDPTLFDQQNHAEWFMPEEYKQLDIEEFLISQCPPENYDRLVKELKLFHQHNMITLLQYLKYLVDTMRANNVVWGVGRGSSVASYALYLLGVHKIDSIKYELDIHEFLKEN
jgi:DNA polymerase III alpha subunit